MVSKPAPKKGAPAGKPNPFVKKGEKPSAKPGKGDDKGKGKPPAKKAPAKKGK